MEFNDEYHVMKLSVEDPFWAKAILNPLSCELVCFLKAVTLDVTLNLKYFVKISTSLQY